MKLKRVTSENKTKQAKGKKYDEKKNKTKQKQKQNRKNTIINSRARLVSSQTTVGPRFPWPLAKENE